MINPIREPMTNAVGFIEADADCAAQGYVRWARSLLGWKMHPRDVEGRFPQVLDSLQPLVTPYKKVLFAETDSRWTAIFFNDDVGLGCREHVGRLAASLKRNAIHASYRPHTLRKTLGGKYEGEFGGTGFCLYGPEDKPRFLNAIRSLTAVWEGKWEFEPWGEQQVFEKPEYYERRKIAERFNAEILDEYLHYYGIRFFDPSFYLPASNSRAVLVE